MKKGKYELKGDNLKFAKVLDKVLRRLKRDKLSVISQHSYVNEKGENVYVIEYGDML